MAKYLLALVKRDPALLCLISLLVISAAGAVLEGSASLAGIGLIYLVVTILGIILTRHWRNAKRFLILMGASVGVFGISVLLYNLIRGLFAHWFGADFWGKTITGDEPLFFGIAVFVCPVAFIIGAAGTIVLAIKNTMRKRKTRKNALP